MDVHIHTSSRFIPTRAAIIFIIHIVLCLLTIINHFLIHYFIYSFNFNSLFHFITLANIKT